MIRRLVEQEQVWAAAHDQRQREPRLLAAREAVAPALPPCRRGNRSRRGNRAAPARAPGSSRHEMLQRRRLRVAAARADAARSSRSRGPARLALARSGAARRRGRLTSVDLPAPFGPSSPMRAPGRRLSRRPRARRARHSRPSTCSTREQRIRRAIAASRKLEIERRVDMRRRDALHALERLQAALRLPRLRRLRAEALDERAPGARSRAAASRTRLLHRRAAPRAARSNAE